MLGVEVAVKEAVLVDVGQALQDLEHPVADLVLGQQPVAVLDHLVQVAFQVFEDKEELVVLPDHLLQLYDARVAQAAERLDLPQCHALVP